MIDDSTKLAIEEKNKEERATSDKRYAPMLAWTILLGILGIFGVAIVQQLAKLIGL